MHVAVAILAELPATVAARAVAIAIFVAGLWPGRPHWPMHRTSFSVVGVDKRFAIRSIEWPT